MIRPSDARSSLWLAAVVATITLTGILATPNRSLAADQITLHQEILPVKTQSATSLRCRVTLTAMQGDGTMAPLQNQILELVRKDGTLTQLRIDAETFDLASKSPTPKQDVFTLLDGKVIEFDEGTNQVRHVDSPSGKGLSSFWVRGASEDMDFVDGKLAVQEKPTHSTETIDGRPMDVYTFVLLKTKDGTPAFLGKYYIDSATGYPFRKSYIVQDKSYYFNASLKDLNTTGPIEYLRRQFSDWEVNPTIAPDRFAYTPPATAKVYVPKPAAPAPPSVAMLEAGKDAPDFTCIGTDGKPVKLSDFKGKTVILDFWATWCGPCQASMPHLERVYKAVKDKNVAVLGVCVNDITARYDSWRTKHKSDYTFPIAFDAVAKGAAQSKSLELYGVSGIPSTFVIGPDGKIVAAMSGYAGESDNRLEEALSKLGITFPDTAKASTTPSTPVAGGS